MTTEVLVIGGGPAGSAAAIRLARGGAQVTLVEREQEPAHKVCGEFLSGEALLYLRELGIDPSSLGAVPLGAVRFTHGARTVETRLPFAAMSLTRRCLDAELLRLAEDSGVNVRRGCAVEHLARFGNTWQATLHGGEIIHASATFLASGKHDLRGHPRPSGRQMGMVAFKMYWRLNAGQTRSLGQTVELITYRGGYAGLQPVEGGMVNLCCLINTRELRRLGRWPDLLAHMCQQSPLLRERLSNAEPVLKKPLTIASLPYGMVRKTSGGLWYLGDQAVVIPSFTGDGTSLALHTGAVSSGMYLRGQSAQSYQETLANQVSRQVAIATVASKWTVRAPRLVTGLLRLTPGMLNVVARLTRIDSQLVESPVDREPSATPVLSGESLPRT